jgi:hypothetical protein
MKLFGRKRKARRDAEAHAEAIGEAYQAAFVAGRVMCQMGAECPSDRAQFPVTFREAQEAGFFDGWVHAQCEIFDETEEGIGAIEAFLEGHPHG